MFSADEKKKPKKRQKPNQNFARQTVLKKANFEGIGVKKANMATLWLLYVLTACDSNFTI